MRLGLFEQLFWRVLALLAAALVLMLALTFAYQQRFLYDAWQEDLAQEARWVALHWSGDFPVTQLAKAWRITHDSVRLTVEDATGKLLADSHPGVPTAAPRDGAQLIGSAPLVLDGQTGTLYLSRSAPRLFPATLRYELLLALLVIVALATAALYPTVRRLNRAFHSLSELAHRVAQGQFGATLPVQDPPDLAELTRSLNEMSLQLRDTELRNQRLTADVSHELRSPLARLRALAQTIERHPHEAPQLLARIEAEIGLLDRLVDDLLAIARLATGRTALSLEQVRLRDWADEVFARLDSRIQAERVNCAVLVEAGEERAMLDPQRLVQALGNLVENALSATAARDEARDKARDEARIELALRCSPSGWTLSVTDNGRGIPEKDLPHIFERFYRVDAHRSRDRGGAGLGLSIVRSIMEAHGGHVRVDSELHTGTCVQLQFPHTFPTDAASAPHISPAP